MSEKTFYNKIKKYLPGTVSRVENLCDPGMPDINGSCQNGDYWIELKSPGLVHPVINPENLLRPDQAAWTTKRIKHGAKVFLAIQYTHSFTILYATLVENKLYYIIIFAQQSVLRKKNGIELTKSILRYLPTRSM